MNSVSDPEESSTEGEPHFHYSYKNSEIYAPTATRYTQMNNSVFGNPGIDPEYFLKERKTSTAEVRRENGNGTSRTDERIRDEVSFRIMMDGEEDPRHLNIQVESGIVRLQGHIDSEMAKSSVERVCASVPGVKGIRNQLQVE